MTQKEIYIKEVKHADRIQFIKMESKQKIFIYISTTHLKEFLQLLFNAVFKFPFLFWKFSNPVVYISDFKFKKNSH